MNVVAVIVVVIVAVGFVLYAAVATLAWIAEAAKTSGNAFVAWLGRKHLQRKAFVPEELEEGSKPLPKSDPDEAALLGYEPRSVDAPPSRVAEFKGMVDSVLAIQPAPEVQIDSDCLPEILAASHLPPYEPLFATLDEEPSYPVPPPRRPADIPKPPSWTPWRPAFKEPSFEPPWYGPKLSFLNRFVEAAYRKETDLVKAALRRRDKLTKSCDARNRKIEDLSRKAEAKYVRATAHQAEAFAAAEAAHRKRADAFVAAAKKEREKLLALQAGVRRTGTEGLLTRVDLAMRMARWPRFVPREGQSRFDVDSGVFIHEHRFPHLSVAEWVKQVKLKSGWTTKSANQREKKEAAVKVYPSLCLRLAAEIARLDDEGIVKAVVVNGWADYADKSTGQRKRAYCASLFATKEQLSKLNLSKLDPVEAFSALKGIAARTLDLIPIAPVLRLDTQDPRFVDARPVLSGMSEGENLAAMHWEDFEHLCRELFEREFADAGAEVKITQASRDQGVDAIVFNPDPLRGGKIVIQAKRYTNIVDVSAVRDLYGTVINEGAIKGILVTTSHFGSESYSFAKDKPITLLTGNELLAMLEKHGYKFRIDLAEAKSML